MVGSLAPHSLPPNPVVFILNRRVIVQMFSVLVDCLFDHLLTIESKLMWGLLKFAAVCVSGLPISLVPSLRYEAKETHHCVILFVLRSKPVCYLLSTFHIFLFCFTCNV